MFNIKDLLEKFKDLKDPIEDKKIITGIIKQATNVELPVESISFRKDSILISTNSVFKNAIYMKKESILKSISAELPDRNISKIF